jgi:hypothetical protein
LIAASEFSGGRSDVSGPALINDDHATHD